MFTRHESHSASEQSEIEGDLVNPVVVYDNACAGGSIVLNEQW